MMPDVDWQNPDPSVLANVARMCEPLSGWDWVASGAQGQSGVQLSPDELQVLADYRSIRDQGKGSLYIEFAAHHVAKWDVKAGGKVDFINRLIDSSRPLRD